MNKVIVVTGGTSGIGREVVKQCEKAGYDVAVVSRTTTDSDGLNVFACDVADNDCVVKTFNEIGKQFGKIDVLVNNAGFGVSGASELIPYSTVENLFDVNVHGVVNCSRAALPFMARGSKIINISSAMAFFAIPYRTFYSATKSAVLNISLGMRLELLPAGIIVSAICPGDVKTNFMKSRVKVFDTNERYGKRVESAVFGVDKKIEKRMSPTIVSNAIFKQIKTKKPKAVTIVGGKYKVLYALQKFLPRSWFLWGMGKKFGGHVPLSDK